MISVKLNNISQQLNKLKQILTSKIMEKKVWTGSERVMGYIVALAILGGIGYGLFIVLPFLITLVTNLFIFLGMVIGATLVVGVIWNNRKMISLAYQIIIKKIWSAMINSNPIAIMEIQCNTWIKQKEKLNENIKQLSAAEQDLLRVMEENKDEANDKFKEAKAAKELAESRNNPDYARKSNKNAIMAQRRVESNKMFIPKLQAIQTALNYCTRVYDAWTDDIELLKDDIREKKRNLSILSKTSGVFEMAQSYLNGNSNERIMFDEANEAYAQRISEYVANIKRFTEQTKDWVFNKDIQEAIQTESGQQYLSMYDEDSFGKLTDFKALMEAQPTTFVEVSDNMNKIDTNTFTKGSSFDGLK